jgi:dUTPase
MRIAQMVFNKIESVILQIVDDLSDTVRNNGGFGHTELY